MPNTPDPAPLYQTEIAQTPLAEVLVKIFKYRAPGRLDCQRGDEIKRIYLDRGEIVFASTNQIAESLGDTLLRDGRITRADYDESLRRVRQTGKRHGTALVEMKLLTAQELFMAVRTHIQEIIWSIFGWEFGTVGFTPGRDKRLEFIKIHIAVPDAVMQGIRRMPDAKSLVARLGSRTTVFARTDLTIEDLTLAPEEEGLFAAIDGKKALYHLVNIPPLNPADNARILYGLQSLGLIDVRDPAPIKVQVKSESKYE